MDVALVLCNLGKAQQALGQHKKASVSYKEALKLYRNKAIYGDKPHADVASVLRDLSLVQKKLKQHKNAARTLKELGEVQQKTSTI